MEIENFKTPWCRNHILGSPPRGAVKSSPPRGSIVLALENPLWIVHIFIFYFMYTTTVLFHHEDYFCCFCSDVSFWIKVIYSFIYINAEVVLLNESLAES